MLKTSSIDHKSMLVKWWYAKIMKAYKFLLKTLLWTLYNNDIYISIKLENKHENKSTQVR